MSTEAQINANRENAQHSTGPRTPEGKAATRLNSLKHGLTGRTVVLPHEDTTEYLRHSSHLLEAMQPETPAEQEAAQTIIDAQWRLQRILSIEDGMLALSYYEGRAHTHGHPSDYELDNPQLNTALTLAAAFREDSRAFVNLSLCEQRLHRILEKAQKRLADLQASRIAEANAQLCELRRPKTYDIMRGLCDDINGIGSAFPTEADFPNVYPYNVRRIPTENPRLTETYTRKARTIFQTGPVPVPDLVRNSDSAQNSDNDQPQAA